MMPVREMVRACPLARKRKWFQKENQKKREKNEIENLMCDVTIACWEEMMERIQVWIYVPCVCLTLIWLDSYSSPRLPCKAAACSFRSCLSAGSEYLFYSKKRFWVFTWLPKPCSNFGLICFAVSLRLPYSGRVPHWNGLRWLYACLVSRNCELWARVTAVVSLWRDAEQQSTSR